MRKTKHRVCTTDFSFRVMLKTNLSHSSEVEKFINDRVSRDEQYLWDTTERKFHAFKKEMEKMGFSFSSVEKTVKIRYV